MYPKNTNMTQSSRLAKAVNRGVLFLSFSVVATCPTAHNGLQTSTDTQTVARIPLNREAKAYIASYIRENREELNLVKARSKQTFSIINKVFAQYGLPAQMKYLAVIESNLKPGATSAVGAKGIWQFMPETAQQLGLKVDSDTDERTLNYKSTIAAAKYLKDLYGQFGDWLLVLAAYNGGPGPVCRAMRKSKSNDFWTLQHYLPAESRMHVKRFIASHYYFEGKGSCTTLTKAEWNTYASTANANSIEQPSAGQAQPQSVHNRKPAIQSRARLAAKPRKNPNPSFDAQLNDWRIASIGLKSHSESVARISHAAHLTTKAFVSGNSDQSNTRLTEWTPDNAAMHTKAFACLTRRQFYPVKSV